MDLQDLIEKKEELIELIVEISTYLSEDEENIETKTSELEELSDEYENGLELIFDTRHELAEIKEEIQELTNNF